MTEGVQEHKPMSWPLLPACRSRCWLWRMQWLPNKGLQQLRKSWWLGPRQKNTSGLLQLLEMQIRDTHGRGEAGGILYLEVITGFDIIKVQEKSKTLALMQCNQGAIWMASSSLSPAWCASSTWVRAEWRQKNDKGSIIPHKCTRIWKYTCKYSKVNKITSPTHTEYIWTNTCTFT